MVMNMMIMTNDDECTVMMTIPGPAVLGVRLAGAGVEQEPLQ